MAISLMFISGDIAMESPWPGRARLLAWQAGSAARSQQDRSQAAVDTGAATIRRDSKVASNVVTLRTNRF